MSLRSVQCSMKVGAFGFGAARERIAFAALALPVAGGACLPSPTLAQAPQLTAPVAQAALQDAVHYQIHELQSRSYSLQYCVDEQNDQGERLRERIETKDGPVYRILKLNGRALNAQDESAEQSRLRSLTAGDVAKKKRSEESNEKFTVDMIGAMPSAYVATPTPGQPQLPGVTTPQIVLELNPNPSFHPANSSQAMLSGLAGRAWLSATDHHLIRIEAHVQRNLNLAWGLIARVYPGGTLSFQQRSVGGGHMLYSEISADVTLREFMVHTRPYRLHLTSCGAKLLPQAPSLAEGVQILLNMNEPPAEQLTRVSGNAAAPLAGSSAHVSATSAHACCAAR